MKAHRAGPRSRPTDRSDALLFDGALPQRPPNLSNHRVRRTQAIVQEDDRDVVGCRPAQRFGIADVPDDQVGPEGIHDACGFRERPRRRHREPQLREDCFAALTAVGVLVYQQHERSEASLVTRTPSAARTMAPVGALTFVRDAGRARK